MKKIIPCIICLNPQETLETKVIANICHVCLKDSRNVSKVLKGLTKKQLDLCIHNMKKTKLTLDGEII